MKSVRVLVMDWICEADYSVRLIAFKSYLDLKRASAAPVGSVKMLNQPTLGISVTSSLISAPRDFAFFVAARMSSTWT